MRAIPAKYVDVPTALWAANKDLVELGESFPTSIYYLLAKFGFDTAKNEPYHFVSSSLREFEFEL